TGRGDPQDIAGFNRYLVSAGALYSRLLKPALDSLSTSSGGPNVFPGDKPARLILVPDGSLCSIPFDALICNPTNTGFVNYATPEYLLTRFPVTYEFSSRMIGIRERVARAKFPDRVLALSFGRGKPGTAGPSGLQWANRELVAIRNSYPGRFLRNGSATESSFKKYGPRYGLIHLALHGQAGQADNDSTLLFFRRKANDPDDGYLMQEELWALSLNARLVVLSSCETGAGQLFQGEGIYSIARAFAIAGCQSLVSTLWPIPDKQTVSIMDNFYRSLRKGAPPGQALQQAKLSYIAQAGPYAAHPLFWGSPIVIGDW
ncbi:MAG: CHAT domain-containing protein, partial [Bacteroidales bacterium]